MHHSLGSCTPGRRSQEKTSSMATERVTRAPPTRVLSHLLWALGPRGPVPGSFHWAILSVFFGARAHYWPHPGKESFLWVPHKSAFLNIWSLGWDYGCLFTTLGKRLRNIVLLPNHENCINRKGVKSWHVNKIHKWHEIGRLVRLFENDIIWNDKTFELSFEITWDYSHSKKKHYNKNIYMYV